MTDICERNGCEKPKKQLETARQHVVKYCSRNCGNIVRNEARRKSFADRRKAVLPEKLCVCGCGRHTKPNKYGTTRRLYFNERCFRDVENRKSKERRATKNELLGIVQKPKPTVPDYSGQNIPDHIAGKFGALVSIRVKLPCH